MLEVRELVQIDNAIFVSGGSLFSVGTYDFTSGGQSGKIYIRSNHPLIGLTIPVGPISLIGISSQYTFSVPAIDGYQILPRDTNDLIIPSGLIITSAVKSIPEIRKNMHAVSKLSGDINFIEDTLENIKKYSGIENFIIVHDFKIDSIYSKIHNDNLKKIKEKYNFNLITSPSCMAIRTALTYENEGFLPT